MEAHMTARRKPKASGIVSQVERQISELKKFHKKHGVKVTVLRHKWPRDKKIIVIMGSNN
jgi:hypothetical protein